MVKMKCIKETHNSSELKAERVQKINQSVKEQKELSSKFKKSINLYNEKIKTKAKKLNEAGDYGLLDRIEDEEGYIIKNISLAGGAPRDWKQNIPAKDLDFFLNVKSIDKGILKDCIEEIFGENSVENIFVQEKSTYMKDFISVCDVLIKDQTLIQIVCFKDCYKLDLLNDSDFAEKVIESFDFNINKCYAVFDEEHRLWFEYTDQYQMDFDLKKLTFNMSYMINNYQYISLLRMPDRVKKIKNRFVGFELEII